MTRYTDQVDIRDSGNTSNSLTPQNPLTKHIKTYALGSIAVVGSFLATYALINNLGATHYDSGLSLVMKVDPETQQAFSDFVAKHQRSFLTKEEYKARLSNFRDNYQTIKSHNEGRRKNGVSFKMGVNQFSDWSKAELNSLNTLREAVDTDEDHTNDEEVLLKVDNYGEPMKRLPKSVDWRDHGAVSPVLNQGRCGGCYAFSTAAAVEGAYFLKSGEFKQLSVQQILDCTNGSPWSNAGCGGGFMTNSFRYLQSNKLMTANDYPYITADGAVCNYDETKGVVGVQNYTKIPQNDTQSLLEAVAKQPVSIAMYASGDEFYYYKTGVLDVDECSVKVNHALVLVGYGHDVLSGKDYWLVKNSWGEKWGENGYIRVKRDNASENSGFGMCGILKMNSYPQV
eukprot:403334193